jgi:ESCRT-I complex subunit TSG101
LAAQKAWEEAQTAKVREQVAVKIRDYCAQQAAVTQADVQQDWKDQQRLSAEQERCIKQKDQLEREKQELERQCEVVSACTDEIQEWLAAHQDDNGKNKTAVDSGQIDEVVKTATARQTQMLDLAAENASIADALYFLDRALYSGKLDCTQHLRSVRQLAKRQFLVRAHMIKIHGAIGSNTSLSM